MYFMSTAKKTSAPSEQGLDYSGLTVVTDNVICRHKKASNKLVGREREREKNTDRGRKRQWHRERGRERERERERKR